MKKMACMSGSTALHRRTIRSSTRRSPHRPTRAQSVALAVAALVIGPAPAPAQDSAVLIRLGATQSYRSSTLLEQRLSESGPGFDAEIINVSQQAIRLSGARLKVHEADAEAHYYMGVALIDLARIYGYRGRYAPGLPLSAREFGSHPGSQGI